ncbi:MAG TPA: AI-2E family transporter [Gemmatimonadales bacterium]|jgi:predicted PurR-regulated permease PerM|nr:AI-2E family transporter [Gemmatimonadales bacterium]
MPLLDSKQQRASLVILILGVALAIALWPFSTGLLGAPVLYVVFAPLHRRLAARMPRGLAAGMVIVLAILVIVLPVASAAGLIANEAQDIAGGVIRSSLVDRLRELRIGPYDVGAQIEALGSRAMAWVGTGALSLVGTLARLGIQLTVAFFGLYYLLCDSRRVWRNMRPFIPFSAENSELLKRRFKDVTVSTLIGTFATATVQGLCVGLAFVAAGLSNAFFWGVVTVIVAILPVVGSGLVWAPAVLVLALERHYLAAVLFALWGIIVIGNIDNIIRPWVFRRYAQIHPFITVIGAFAGLKYFGLLGLLVGPLAISYFFELIRMYREEYLADEPIEAEPPAPPRKKRSWRRGKAG